MQMHQLSLHFDNNGPDRDITLLIDNISSLVNVEVHVKRPIVIDSQSLEQLFLCWSLSFSQAAKDGSHQIDENRWLKERFKLPPEVCEPTTCTTSELRLIYAKFHHFRLNPRVEVKYNYPFSTSTTGKSLLTGITILNRCRQTSILAS